MGRHSAPDEDDDLSGAAVDARADSGLAVLDADDEAADDEPRGRHAFRVAMPEPATAPGESPPTVPSTDDTPTAETVAVSAASRPASGTRADLAMLRSSSGLRARATAAVVVPIALYVVVLAVLGRFDVFVYWVWIPIVVAGVLFGLMLDLADRRPKSDPSADDDLNG